MKAAVRDIDLIKRLQVTGKSFFTIADLGKVTGLERESLYVALSRWIEKGVLERAARGIYVIPGAGTLPEFIAGQLYFPCYLGFESALSRLGILNLVPYALSFATPRKTKTLELSGRTVNYRQLKEELFFGFGLGEGYYIAEAEKALLDLVYMHVLGRSALPVQELNVKSLLRTRLREYARRFPPAVSIAVERML